MKSLADTSTIAVSHEARKRLELIFADAHENLEDYEWNEDVQNGQVMVSNVVFAYKEGALRMMGDCPICNGWVGSRPIKKFADIGDLIRNWKPAKHDCIDI